jgi:WD40 repeat protein
LAVSESGGRVTLWDVGKGALRHTWSGGGSAMVFSPDGKRLAIAAASADILVAGGSVAVRDTASGSEVARASTDATPFGVALGANGEDLVVETNNTSVAVYSAADGKKLGGGGSAETGATFGIALSPDGRWAAASAPAGHGLQVFDVHAWGPRTLVVVPEGACLEHVAPEFSPNGRLVLAYGGQRWVKAFEAGTWKPYASYHAPPARELARAAPDVSRVVVTSAGGRDPAVVTVATNAEIKLERPLEDASFAISADGLHVAASAGGAVRVWSAKTGRVEYDEGP